MKIQKLIFMVLVCFLVSGISYSQNQPNETPKPKVKLKEKESRNNWTLNMTFSDNGFGVGATKYFNLSKDVSFIGSITVSGAKDDREFEQSDIFGNSITPFKENRLFMAPVINLGMQFRLFSDDVTDNMRPFVNFGVAPAAIVYTPYNEPFFTSFGHARAKYTVGGFAGVGLDYLTSKTSALSFNVRYYYMNLFGEGIKSISTNEKKDFGGIYFIFGYNFLSR